MGVHRVLLHQNGKKKLLVHRPASVPAQSVQKLTLGLQSSAQTVLGSAIQVVAILTPAESLTDPQRGCYMNICYIFLYLFVQGIIQIAVRGL